MNWTPFHIETADKWNILGLTVGMLFGHTPNGDPVLTFIISRGQWSKAIQI
jgi:hypothetical protein